MYKQNTAAVQPGFRVSKWKNGRFWALWDGFGRLVCVCVYKKGAREVQQRLEAGQTSKTVERTTGKETNHGTNP